MNRTALLAILALIFIAASPGYQVGPDPYSESTAVPSNTTIPWIHKDYRSEAIYDTTRTEFLSTETWVLMFGTKGTLSTGQDWLRYGTNGTFGDTTSAGRPSGYSMPRDARILGVWGTEASTGLAPVCTLRVFADQTQLLELIDTNGKEMNWLDSTATVSSGEVLVGEIRYSNSVTDPHFWLRVAWRDTIP